MYRHHHQMTRVFLSSRRKVSAQKQAACFSWVRSSKTERRATMRRVHDAGATFDLVRVCWWNMVGLSPCRRMVLLFLGQNDKRSLTPKRSLLGCRVVAHSASTRHRTRRHAQGVYDRHKHVHTCVTCLPKQQRKPSLHPSTFKPTCPHTATIDPSAGNQLPKHTHRKAEANPG